VKRPRYRLDVTTRIPAILGTSKIPHTAELSYSFDEGYERLTFRSSPQSGRIEYAGANHPDPGHCDTGTDEDDGICIYCGRTML
jgi:hypothetical protein